MFRIIKIIKKSLECFWYEIKKCSKFNILFLHAFPKKFESIRVLKIFGFVVKEAVSRDFCSFFSWIELIWVPDKLSKMVLLKNSFSRRYSQKTWQRAVWYCARRRVGKLKCPKIQNCLTLRRVGLCVVRYCAESDSAECDAAPSQTFFL